MGPSRSHAGKLQTGNTFPKQYWLAVNGKPKTTVHIQVKLRISFLIAEGQLFALS